MLEGIAEHQSGRNASRSEDINYPQTIPFVLIHLACLGVVVTGIDSYSVTMAIVLYFIRMWAICAGYHRYFSHRSFSSSRAFQFCLAFLAQTTVQNDVIWWAAKHREHHRFSDTDLDVHSARHQGFFYAHMGWFFARRTGSSRTAVLNGVSDLTKYPELVWLQKFDTVPAVVLAIITFLLHGWIGLVVGFFWSTVALYQATFSINTFAHLYGRQRYVTGDDSRNSWLLSLITLGEGWHNNHHAFQASARQGFRWWEIDITFYTLQVLSWIGVVWDVKSPPDAVVNNEHHLGARVVEKVATELAMSFQNDRYPRLQGQLLNPANSASVGNASDDRPADLPGWPTRQAIMERARLVLPPTRSLDSIVDRAYVIAQRPIG
jgi:stearoyl-CoA desaturase (delta-9 desaturase)